jgi:spermidine/putrescine transport system substrate-binding protein
VQRRRFLAISLGAAGCASTGRLNVFNWSDYVAADTIPNFEKEAGIRVRYGLYESAEEMLARVMSGNSGWDVVFPSNAFIGPMRELGLLAGLPSLAESAALDPLFQRPPWDPDLRYAIPYMWGATGIAFQASLSDPPRRWADLWDARLRGRVTMLDDPAEVFAAALKKRGYSLNSGDPQQLAEARDEAIAQKRALRGYLNAEARDQLIAGDLLAAQAWQLTARQAMALAPGRIAFHYPEEGFPIYADCAAVLKESKRASVAIDFLRYLLRPGVAAAIAREMHTATCNREAQRLLGIEDRVPPGGEWFAPLDAANQRLRDRYWTEIKSA